jgi:maltose alpha-D-glucosyltransferase/alpha-amylase
MSPRSRSPRRSNRSNQRASAPDPRDLVAHAREPSTARHAPAPMLGEQPDVIPDLWFKNAIIYNLDVRSYMDADGDGVGDFRGLTGRLDYLAGLGITCLWLMPFYPTPDRDDGYDIRDYYGVDPRYGTLGEFVEFTCAAEQRGIRVIADLVVNHVSKEHPWFQLARRDPSSKYRDWFIWSKKRPRDWNKGMVFPGVQKSTWTWDDEARAWYLHRFYDFQPDLNTQHPEVQQEIRRVMGYWLAVGVNGFRMDAVPYMIADKGPELKRVGMHYDMLRDLRSFASWRRGDSVMLAEANVSPDVDRLYFGAEGERLPMIFNFHVNQHLFWSMAAADARPLSRALEATRARPPSAQWAHFLRNNDELDLGRLPERARQLCFAEFAPERHMQLYQRGIRRRLAPMLKGDRRRIELAYSLLFALPGTPIIRYGDELGMGDDLDLPERRAIRTPMQWSNDRNGGFSTAKKTIQPAISDGTWGYEHVNAADQRRDAQSLLNWTERMIRTRKECPEVGWGAFEIRPTRARSVLVLRYQWRNNALYALHNFAAEPAEIELREPDFLTNLLAPDDSRPSRGNRHHIALEPYGYRWFRVGRMNYLTRQRDY